MTDRAIEAPGDGADALEQFVFGYGSLTRGFGGRSARLKGHRRVWGVAMDNRVTIPGYKLYRRREDGGRPAVYVAFLDIVEDPDAATEGVLFAVDDAALLALDERERNYERIDVSDAVQGAAGTVWTYRGSDAGRARLRAAIASGCAVVAADYVEALRATFATLGVEDDLALGELPPMDLERIDLDARYRTPKPSPLLNRPMSLDSPT